MGAKRIARDKNGSILYYYTDHLGSTRALQQGNTISRLDYAPFGEDLTENNGGYKFTGKEDDVSTGLYYFNARYYDPAIGRFITEDSAKDGVNWYVYCGNNPLRYVDPTGNEAWEGQKEWTEEDWEKYHKYVEEQLPDYGEKHEGVYYCSELARQLVIDLARENGLRIKFHYKKLGICPVTIDSADNKWSGDNAYNKFIKATENVGAERIAKYNTKVIDFKDALSGDLLIYDYGHCWHTRVIYKNDIKYNRYIYFAGSVPKTFDKNTIDWSFQKEDLHELSPRRWNW